MRFTAIALGLSLLETLAACSSPSSPPSNPADAGASSDSGSSPSSDGSDLVPIEAGADDSGAACGTLPTTGVYATFTVGSDSFHVSITNRTAIDSAIGLWKGTSTAAIPNGDLICQRVSWNCPWHWQMDPVSVDFADVTTEVCDGVPGDVEKACASFGSGRYCPWSAKLTELRDCRTDSTCPSITK